MLKDAMRLIRENGKLALEEILFKEKVLA